MNLWVLDYRMKGIYEMKKGAFTLAEVLLTLAIIGVVAAMTVPSLMTSTEDKKLSAAAKKAYNTLQNAITMKQAQTDLTPADTTQGELLKFLMGQTPDNVQVLKFTEEADTVVQTPDGILFAVDTGTTQCGTGEANESGEFATTKCAITVDVNGSEGPHFSGVTAGQTAAGAAISALTATNAQSPYARGNRDIIRFIVNGTNVYPDSGDAVTMRYIKGKK